MAAYPCAPSGEETAEAASAGELGCVWEEASGWVGVGPSSVMSEPRSTASPGDWPPEVTELCPSEGWLGSPEEGSAGAEGWEDSGAELSGPAGMEEASMGPVGWEVSAEDSAGGTAEDSDSEEGSRWGSLLTEGREEGR